MCSPGCFPSFARCFPDGPALFRRIRPRSDLATTCRKGRCAGGDHAHLQSLLLPGCHRASVVGKVPVPLRFLLSTLLMPMKKNATDRFMRDTIRCCYGAEGFLLLHHTMNDQRPVFSGNTVFEAFWPWSPFANNRRRADVICFVVSEQFLYLEIQFARRGKEKV